MRLLRNTAPLLILFFLSHAPAQDALPDGSIAVESPENYALSYKQRRSKHGVLFSLDMEKFYPVDYQSLHHDVYIEKITGDKIDLVGFDLGYKYNVSLGSVSVLFNYAQGLSTGARDLVLTKQGLSANVALDAMFEEPWIVPYLQVGVHQFSVTEQSDTFSESASTGFALNYRYGLSLQLNWIENAIDKNSQSDALRSSGLENTFIDIYFANYMASGGAQDPSILGSAGEPNMASAGEMGIGLKLEF